MGRKRLDKKRQRREEEILGRIRELHARGADRDLLGLVHHGDVDPAHPRVADLYGPALDRHLTQLLRAGEAQAAKHVAARVPPGARERPLVALTHAVAALWDGSYQIAAERLERLAGASCQAQAAAAPPRLVSSLCQLARSAARDGRHGAMPDAPAAVDLVRLRRALDRDDHLSNSAPAAARLGLSLPLARSLWNLARATQVVHAAGESPSRRQVRALSKAAVDAAREAGGEPTLAHLARTSEITATLVQLAEKTARQGPGQRLETLTTWLRGERHSDLTRRLEEPSTTGPGEVVRRLLHRSWRAVLESVVAGNPEQLAALALSFPALLAPDVELESTGSLPPQEVLEVRRRLAACCCDCCRGVEEAALLERLSRGERDPARLVTLWGAELELLQRSCLDLEVEDGDESPLLPVLRRLTRVIQAVGERVPAERRPGTAHHLKRHLVWLTEELSFGEALARPALELLKHLPDDAALMIVAQAGLVGTEMWREAGAMQRRIAASGRSAVVDEAAVLAVMSALGREPPPYSNAVLDAVRPLLSDELWAQAMRALATTHALLVAAALAVVAIGGLQDDLDALGETVEELAPRLAGIAQYEALRTAVACARGDRWEVAVDRFHERFADLDAAVFLLNLLFVSSGLERGSGRWPPVMKALGTFVERLDTRVEQWGETVDLVVDLMRGSNLLLRLQDRLLQIRLQLGPESEARAALDHLLARVERAARPFPGQGRGGQRRAGRSRRDPSRQASRNRPRPGSARPGRDEVDVDDGQLPLDF